MNLPFNRTSMESKHPQGYLSEVGHSAFNRTSMESKQYALAGKLFPGL